jgi:hypothetical protein
MNTDKWLAKAAPHPKRDAEWIAGHPDAVRVISHHFATDGVRMHWMLGHNWPTGQTWQNARELVEIVSKAEISAAVSTEHLVVAVKVAQVINNHIVLEFGAALRIGTTLSDVGDVVTVLAQSDQWPRWSKAGRYTPTFVTYRKEGPDITVRASAVYLLDALAGMDWQTTLCLLPYNGGHVLMLSSQNQNRALVMGLVEDDKGPHMPEEVVYATANG